MSALPLILLGAGGAIVLLLFLVRGNAFDAPGRATVCGVGGMMFCSWVPWAHSVTHGLIITAVASLAGCLDIGG